MTTVFRVTMTLSLVVHGVALALAPAFPTAPAEPPPLQVSLQVSLRAEVPEPPKSVTTPVSRKPVSQVTEKALLSGGATLSDAEEVTASAQAVAAPVAHLAQATVARSAATATAGSDAALSQGVLTSDRASRLQVASRLAQTAAVSTQGVASARQGAETADSVAGAVRRDWAQTERSSARMAQASAVAQRPQPQLSRGGLDSADAQAARHAGPEVLLPNTLVMVSADSGLDPSALAHAPSGLVFKAALMGDGKGCFTAPGGRLEGLVVLGVRVDRGGRATEVWIQQGSGVPHLDERAQRQARECARFVVHNRRGEPVAARLNLPIRYRSAGAMDD